MTRTASDFRASAGKADQLAAYDQVVLVLQGGGALGSYQAGIYQGLAEARIEPSWIAGISIGALNTAIIAGNPPELRVEALKGFWEAISRPEDAIGAASAWTLRSLGLSAAARRLSSGWSAWRTIMEGQAEFFSPVRHFPLSPLDQRRPDQVSYYETEPMIATLERFVDFDRINDGDVRVSIGAVNVRDGNFSYFDNRRTRLEARHFLASGALPPGFPAVEIEGEYYWDGGLVSNTPLMEVFREASDEDVLVFQVDLWSARGQLPDDYLAVEDRIKSIRYSSRTRAITDMMRERRSHARIFRELLKLIPAERSAGCEAVEQAQAIGDVGAVNLFQLIYENKPFETHYRDAEFSRETMLEHWESGLSDMRRSLAQPGWLAAPTRETGFVAHDVHRAPAPAGASAVPRAGLRLIPP